MRKVLLYIGLIFFFFIVGFEAIAEYRSPYLQPRKKEPPKARSRPKFEPGKTPVHLIADTMSYNNETGVYTARGNVVIKQVEQTLKADYVEYNYNTQVARANGHVVYKEEGGDNLTCNYLEMNMGTKEGFAKEGKVFYQKDNVYLNGSNIEKLGEKQYRITDGEITTCDGKKPAWKFKCKKVDITLEGLAKAKHATFKIKEVPVAYFPYLAYPALIKRQSGFLTPSVGISNTDGIKIDNSYYWAISPNTDATFNLDVATKKGVGVGGEYRYITSETSKGRLYGYFIQESNSYQDDKYSELYDRGQDRWNIVYEGKKDFDPTFFARAKADVVSDREFYHDYGSHTNVRSAEQTQSSASITKHWENFSLVGDVEYNYTLLEPNDLPSDSKPFYMGNKTTLQRYPQIMLSGIPIIVPHTPLYFSLNSDYAHFYREQGTDTTSYPIMYTKQGDRVEFDPRLMLPLSVMKNFFLQTEAGFLQTSYFNTSDDKGLDDSRSLFHVTSNLSTKFMKIYDLGSGNKLRHTIQPEFLYTYIPHRNQNDLPRYDEFDNIAEENLVALAISNRLVSKTYSKGGLSSVKEILFLRLGQYYDLSTSHDPFSDFFLELRSQPFSWMRLKSNLAYDIYDQEFDTLNGSINFEDPRKDSLELSYRYTASQDQATDPLEPIGQPNYLAGLQLLNGGIAKIDPLVGTKFVTEKIEEFDSRVSLVLTPTTSLFFQNRTNVNEQKTLENLFGIDYHPQCWGTILSYRMLPKTEGRDKETRIMFEFYLKGIGRVAGIRAY